MTFTLLSFTSFEQQIRYASFRLPHDGAYPGILIRDRGWERLTPEALDYAESHFGGSGWMGRRGWYAAEGGKGGWIAVTSAGKAVRATGLLGLTPEEAQITEVDESLVAGSFFAADDEATCILPLDMAEALGVGVGDRVEVFGRALKVRGIADPERLGELRDLDDESLMPADFVLSGAEMLQLGAAQDVDIAGEEDPHELRPFIHLEPHHVVPRALSDAG